MRLNSKIANYDWEKGYTELRDDFLSDNNIVTYLISPITPEPRWTAINPANTIFRRQSQIPRSSVSTPLYDKKNRNSVQGNRRKSSARRKKISIVDRFIPNLLSNRRSLFMDDTNREYQEMINAVDLQMDKEIEKLPLGKLQ